MTDSGEFLAVDPSIASTGVSLFRDGKLVAVTVARVKTSHAPMGQRCLTMAHKVVDWIAVLKARPQILVFEWPQIYRATKSKGSPADLVPMAGVGMGIAGVLSIALAARQQELQVLTYLPGEWTGQLPKNTKVDGVKFSPRAKRIAEHLTDEELEIWDTTRSHDAIDSIGIGLYSLGRLEPVRVFPGASIH
jgi:hypothetical protein